MNIVGGGGLGNFPANMAECTGIPVSVTRTALRRMEKRGLVTSYKGNLRTYHISKHGRLLVEAIEQIENLWKT